jgi:hypothetical protein
MNMPFGKHILSAWLIGIVLSVGFPAQATTPDEHTIISLDQPVHFLGTEGTDVVADPGNYSVETVEVWLRLIPVAQRGEALLLKADKGTYDVQVEIPMALYTPGTIKPGMLAVLFQGPILKRGIAPESPAEHSSTPPEETPPIDPPTPTH